MDLLAERDISGAVTAGYTHGHTPIDGIGSTVAAKKDVGGTTYYQYPVMDHRGTVVRLVDDTGAVTAYYEYDAWGVPLRDDDTPVGNRLRYQSNWIELRDSGGRLLLSPTRLYDAEVARFLSRDMMAASWGRYPSGRTDGSSEYAYAFSAPTSLVDPDGRDQTGMFNPANWDRGAGRDFNIFRLAKYLMKKDAQVKRLGPSHPKYAHHKGIVDNLCAHLEKHSAAIEEALLTSTQKMRDMAVAAYAAARLACALDDVLEHAKRLASFGLTPEAAGALLQAANAVFVLYVGNEALGAGSHLVGLQEACVYCETTRKDQKGKHPVWRGPEREVLVNGSWIKEPIGCRIGSDCKLYAMSAGVYRWVPCKS